MFCVSPCNSILISAEGIGFLVWRFAQDRTVSTCKENDKSLRLERTIIFSLFAAEMKVVAMKVVVLS